MQGTNLLPFMPECLKLASYEDLPLEVKEGRLSTAMPYEVTEVKCGKCRRPQIMMRDIFCCPWCIVDSRLVKEARAALQNAEYAYRQECRKVYKIAA